MSKIDTSIFTLQVPSYLDKHTSVEVRANLDLATFGPRIKSAVRKSLTSNLANFMPDCKSGVLYTAICEKYDIPTAYYSTRVDRYSKGHAMHIHRATQGLQDILETAQELCKPEGKAYYRISYYSHRGYTRLHTWACFIPFENVAAAITEHRPPDPEAVALALDFLENGTHIEFSEQHLAGDDNA